MLPAAITAAALVTALLLIWLGYPALIAALAAARRRPRPDDAGQVGPAPTVSAVVASADDAESIRARVANLLDTDYPAHLLEVVVALDGVNGRATIDDLSFDDPRVRVVVGDQPGGKASTLNAGVRAAGGELLVFSDTHQRFDARSIPVLADALARDSRLGAVSGALAISDGRRARTPAELYWVMERRLRADEARLHSVVGVTGAVYAMRRALWSPLRAGLILDDLMVPMRLVLDGHRVGFAADARAVDGRTFTARQEFRRKVRTLTGNVQLCAWLPAVLVPWRNPIWLQFVCHKLLRLLTPYLVLALGVALAWLAGVGLWRLGGWPALLATAAGVAIALLVLPAVRRRVVRQLEWIVLLQAAAVVGTFNGLRGRWTVWQR
ncbi:MAG: glycosyltransferase [Gemmatimonadaceae bacterium]